MNDRRTLAVVDEYPSAAELPTITRVITTREQGSDAEREALARLRAVIETAVDGIITIDEEGVIESVNPAVIRIFGYDPDELIGYNVRVLMPEPYRSEHDGYLSKYLKTGERKIIGIGREVQGRRKDGTVFPMELAVSETRLGDRTIFTGVVRDISERRCTEQARRESEQRFGAFMRHLPGAAWIKDLEGRYVYANPEAERIFNAPLGELRGRTDDELFLPETARQFRENDQRALRGDAGPQSVEILRQANGVDHHSIVSKFTLPGVDGRPAFVGGIAIDITALKRAENALRASENRFRLMADSAPNMIWMSGIDKACDWVNRRWLEFTGRTMEQEIGDGWSQCVHPDDLERCLETYNDAFDARQPFEMEYRLRRFDGQFRWVHDVGVPIRLENDAFAGFIGSCIDVTDRRLDEENLLERVAKRTHDLTSANEQLQHEITERRRIESMLATENRILELIAKGADQHQLLKALCEAVERLIANTRCAIRLGSADADAASPPDANGVVKIGLNVFGRAAQDGIYPPIRLERTIVSSVSAADGAEECLDVFGIRSYWLEPIAAPGGTMVGTLGVYCTDCVRPDEDLLSVSSMAARLAGIIVERARAEERAREQLAQLAHIGRLATMGEMASGLAHELNQPLCAIVNYTEACLEFVNGNGRHRRQLPETLAEVAKQAGRAGEVIRRLREFVKRRAPERQAVDINKLVREVVAFTGVEARHNDFRIRMKLARQPPKVFADSIQIEQVLVNLVRNAGEAMRECRSTARVLTIETLRHKGAVEVAVSDTGPGISDQTKQRLFEPFFTTKSDGMGMGLSISRSILEVHDGRIWVTPNRQGGTTFHFTLPTAWRARRDRRHRIRS